MPWPHEKDTLTLDDLLGSHFAFLEANAADIKIVLGTYSILELTKRSMGRFIERMRSFSRTFSPAASRTGPSATFPWTTRA